MLFKIKTATLLQKYNRFIVLVDRIIELSDLKLGFVEVFEYLGVE